MRLLGVYRLWLQIKVGVIDLAKSVVNLAGPIFYCP